MGTRIRFGGLLIVSVLVLGLAPEVGARPFSGPEISGFSPPAGVVGTAVTITGSGFTGATSVTFNDVAAAFTVVDDADIQTSVPFGVTTGKIAVTTPAGTESSVSSFRVQPMVTGFSPGWGLPGTVVTISGSAFTGATAVSFHGVSASFTVDSYSQITATVPAGATTGKVRVTTKVGTASTGSVFDVLVKGPGWEQYGHDSAHSGYNPNETMIGPGNVSTLQVAWHNATGKTGAPVEDEAAIADGVAYVGSSDGVLHAFDAVTGTQLWSAPTGSGISASPAVANGIVYVNSDGKLNAFDTASAALLWSVATGPGGGGSSPAVANGVVYVGSLEGLEAFDAASGAQLWGFPIPGKFYGSPAVANGIVYFGAQGWAQYWTLYALDAASGALLWSANSPTIPTTSPVTSPTVANGLVYVGTQEGATCKLYAFDAHSGALRWCGFTENAIFTPPAVANGVVYVGPYNGLSAFNAANGDWLWAIDIDYGNYNSSPVVANGVVYRGANDGSLYAFDPANGTQLWHTVLPGLWYLIPSPVIANGIVYIGSRGKLNAYHLPGPCKVDCLPPPRS